MAQRKPSTPPAIEVEPRPGGRWAVQKQGTARASKVVDRKTDAVTSARAQARREGSRAHREGPARPHPEPGQPWAGFTTPARLR
jgi:hypothetical protein